MRNFPAYKEVMYELYCSVNYSWPVFVAVVQFIVPIFVQLIVNDCFIDKLNELFSFKRLNLLGITSTCQWRLLITFANSLDQN